MDTVKDLPSSIVPKCDFILILFVLSSISPDNMKIFIKNSTEPLKSGGILLFRDYAYKDHAQIRFGPDKRLSENFYVRQDGTRSYFFKEGIFLYLDEIVSLFSECGFEIIEKRLIRKKIINRKENKEMHRIWINAKFRKL